MKTTKVKRINGIDNYGFSGKEIINISTGNAIKQTSGRVRLTINGQRKLFKVKDLIDLIVKETKSKPKVVKATKESSSNKWERFEFMKEKFGDLKNKRKVTLSMIHKAGGFKKDFVSFAMSLGIFARYSGKNKVFHLNKI